jgi:Response regulator of the LytR/AlgR family
MLRIAICDDMPDQLELLSDMALEYISTQSPDAEIVRFLHPDVLITACETESFHIYLLDIVMPMISGLELGRNIRRLNQESQIIYTTTEPGFALDAYAVNPLHYLIKPIDKQELFHALELAASKVCFGKEATITIKTKVGLRTLSVGSIVCCEYSRHIVIYKLLSGEQVETTTITCRFSEHVVPILKDKRFLQPHVSYVINMNWVEKLTREGFFLRNGVFVPIPYKQFTAVRNAYLDYRLGVEVK